MAKVILQPTSNAAAKTNLTRTIDQPVVLSEHREVLGADYTPLAALFPTGSCAMWGITPSKVKIGQHARMDSGDAVLFAKDGRFFLIGTVAYTWRSETLARRLWGQDDNGQTWELMYALDDLRDIEMPYAEFNRAVGYAENNVPQGFTVVSDERSAGAFRLLPESQRHFPEVTQEQYEETVREFPDELDQQVRGSARVEQGFLRRRLFGSRPVGPCALCGRELPVDLLVAAHIKKRSACSHEERLDVDHIVMAACRLGCDNLFELGYIAVDENGTIIASVPESIKTDALNVAVTQVEGRRCAAFNDRSRMYFDWHRSHTFRA